MLSTATWELLWKFWILGFIAFIVILLNRRKVFIYLFSVLFWLKEGVEDADGQFNSKDLWLMIFSITLIVMGFLEWATQKPFSAHFWTIISVLAGGGAV